MADPRMCTCSMLSGPEIDCPRHGDPNYGPRPGDVQAPDGVPEQHCANEAPHGSHGEQSPFAGESWWCPGSGRPVTGRDVRPCTCFPYVEQHGEPGLEPNPDCPVHFPPTRCCTCRDIEDDANPECVLHGDPAVNGTADYSRPGDPACAEPGCESAVRRFAGQWWHVQPAKARLPRHPIRPTPDPIAELHYETTLDEDERHNR